MIFNNLQAKSVNDESIFKFNKKTLLYRILFMLNVLTYFIIKEVVAQISAALQCKFLTINELSVALQHLEESTLQTLYVLFHSSIITCLIHLRTKICYSTVLFCIECIIVGAHISLFHNKYIS